MKWKYLIVLLLLLFLSQGMCQNVKYSRTKPKNNYGIIYTKNGKNCLNQKKYFKRYLQDLEYLNQRLNDSCFSQYIRYMNASRYGEKLLDMNFLVDYIETINTYFLQNDHVKKDKLYVLHVFADSTMGYDFRILTTNLENDNGEKIEVGEKYAFKLYQIYGNNVLIYPQNTHIIVGQGPKVPYYYKKNYIPYLEEKECIIYLYYRTSQKIDKN